MTNARDGGRQGVATGVPPGAQRWPVPAAALAAFAVYLATMNRTFGIVDGGELAACAWTLGVAHPTGYPTLMLLGWLASHAWPASPILALNILAAALTAGSVAALAGLFESILQATGLDAGGARGCRQVAALAALATGLMGAWWSQGTGWEVYCLHALMLPLVCLAFLRLVEQEAAAEAAAGAAPPRPGFTRRGHAFAFLVGLSLTNHLTTGLLAPAFLLLWFARLVPAARTGRRQAPARGGWARALRRWLYLAPAFLLGLVPPYLLLMARAAARPVINWGAPDNLPDLLHHVRGRDYGHVMGHFLDGAFFTQFAYFLHWLPGAVGYVGLATGAWGLVVLWRRSRLLAAWSLLVFGASVFAACSYNVNDIGNYFMGAVLMVGLWSAVALAAAWQRFGARAGLLAGVALVAVLGAAGWRANDERGNTITEDFARNMLGSLPPDAIILTQQWDFWESGSLYLQLVEGYRRDVTVIDTDSLHADWYIDQLTRAHPQVMAPVKSEADRVAEGARSLRRGRLRTQQEQLQYARDFYALVDALLERNSPAHPCYMTYDPFDPYTATAWRRVPWGLAQRLVKDESYLPAEPPQLRFRMWNRHLVPQVVWTLKLYAEACQNRAAYEHAHGRDDLARRYAEQAVSFDPGFDPDRVPDFPANIEAQVAGELRRFARARADLARGAYPGWY